uniref:Uncharacterized protein n=2 Tax=Candidatus Kentrum sp. FM TaxID=2126340 RepID=A0A450WDC0_9GAMM|nr:MAG: hypothetical protein BECKFM1743A_GA0114220_103454 [Candidatus Kentron sp. FM]VFK15022.1 MAG: hypothetical protein BECKFM1743B_GA0114221_103502 [Candidatus Kentron sp. FM]
MTPSRKYLHPVATFGTARSHLALPDKPYPSETIPWDYLFLARTRTNRTLVHTPGRCKTIFAYRSNSIKKSSVKVLLINLFRLLLDSGLMADRCNYTSGIDMGARMFGGEHLGSPYAPPNVGANLVFAHYA